MTSLPLFTAVDLAGKVALVRVDFNLPIKDGRILDSTRIEAVLPTIKTLIAMQAKVVLLSHRGRPKGKVVRDLSLKIVVSELEKHLGRKVKFGAEAINSMNPGEVLMLENLRFSAGEEKNDETYARDLASLGDVYINDAFAVSHRAHASVVAITKYLPSYAGLLLAKEVKELSTAIDHDSKPIMAIIGGSKISTKIALLESLIEKVDVIVVGGGIANTLLFSQGLPVGKSLAEHDQIYFCQTLLEKAKSLGCKIIIPKDVVVATDPNDHGSVRTVAVDKISSDESIFDLGPGTVHEICEELNNVNTVIWNGPVGMFEVFPFNQASFDIATKIAAIDNLKSIAGGGETIAVIKQAGVASSFSYLSTGGGAFLEFIEGRELPGIKVLSISEA